MLFNQEAGIDDEFSHWLSAPVNLGILNLLRSARASYGRLLKTYFYKSPARFSK